MKGIKAEQFDPAKDYPEHAWCAGPMDFRHASHRGHDRLTNRDWIITFLETGEHIAVTDATYQAYFTEPPIASIVSKYLAPSSDLPAQEASPEASSEDKPQNRRFVRPRTMERQDSQPGKPPNGEDDSSDA